MKEIYLFYIPVVQLEDGEKVGGVAVIKNSVPHTAIGFATEALARECLVLRNVTPGVQVISLSQLRREDPESASKVRTVVLIPDSLILYIYAAAPAAFSCEQYFVTVDPASTE